MAVEARHLNLFPPQINANRGMVMNGLEGIGNAYATPPGFGMLSPLSGTAAVATTETVVPMYCSAIAETILAKSSAMKSDSGLTYAVPVSRKRSRDAINTPPSMLPTGLHQPTTYNRRGSFSFLGEDLSLHFQQQQLEIDRFIAQHTENVRLEIEERRKRYSRRIAVAVEENIMKKRKSKEEEIEKMGKLNCALEERVKSLCVENQIWRDLAQANEATANALRCSLEQVLAQIQDEQQQQQELVVDEAQSCCGSNSDETVAAEGRSSIGANRMCRKCGKEESCVLLLPCRHLCLCTLCGSSLHTCPVCNSNKTASVHVNLSAS